MSTLLAAGAVILALLMIYRLILTSGSTIQSFNPRRAATTMRRPNGGNALLILAAVNVATLGFEIADQASNGGPDIAAAAGIVIPAVILIALVALVITRSIADLVLGVIGGGAALTGAYLEHGPAGLTAVLVLTVLVLFLLGFLRGILRAGR